LLDLAAVGMNVEKKPLARGWQGSAKEDWVTEWFFGKNENSMVSPALALISLGLNTREPLPTDTEMVAACARAAEAVARTAVEKCMLT